MTKNIFVQKMITNRVAVKTAPNCDSNGPTGFTTTTATTRQWSWWGTMENCDLGRHTGSNLLFLLPKSSIEHDMDEGRIFVEHRSNKRPGHKGSNWRHIIDLVSQGVNCFVVPARSMPEEGLATSKCDATIGPNLPNGLHNSVPGEIARELGREHLCCPTRGLFLAHCINAVARWITIREEEHLKSQVARHKLNRFNYRKLYSKWMSRICAHIVSR